MSEDAPRKRKVPVRWVTLGEAVAIAAVAISALGLYNGWGGKDAAPPPAEKSAPAKPLTLKATAQQDGDRLSLAPLLGTQLIQSQTIQFPTALKVSPVETTGDPRLEAGWISRPLRRLAEDAAKPSGDSRLPVLITTRYTDGDVERTETALYQLGYRLEEGGLFGGGGVRLCGLSLVERGVKNGQQRLDALWKPPAK